jgi:putative redox protein
MSMTFPPLSVSMELISDKVRFTGALRDNPPVTVDYTAPIGDGLGYTSLELFLMSLGTCVGSTVLLVLRKMRKTITGCTVTAQGTRRGEHPTCFARIVVEIVLHSPDVTEHDVQQALHIGEETLCPVWAMIKGNVEVVPRVRIVAWGEGEGLPVKEETSCE